MSAEPDGNGAPRTLLALYDDALPVVYGYFVRRCSDRGTAEDLTSETFLAAMDAARAGRGAVRNNGHARLTGLHGDELPVQPAPASGVRLRARFEDPLPLPNRTQGVVMRGPDTAIAELNEPAAEPTVAAAPPRS